MDARRRSTMAGVPALALAVALALTGCSGQATQYGKLAQATGTASSAAQSAAYTLSLHALGDLTGAVTSTSLTDAMTNLQQSAKALTGMTLTDGPRAARDDLLRYVRAAQDAVLRAQAALQTDPHGAASGARTALEQAAQALSHRQSDLKAKE